MVISHLILNNLCLPSQGEFKATCNAQKVWQHAPHFFLSVLYLCLWPSCPRHNAKITEIYLRLRYRNETCFKLNDVLFPSCKEIACILTAGAPTSVGLVFTAKIMITIMCKGQNTYGIAVKYRNFKCQVLKHFQCWGNSRSVIFYNAPISWGTNSNQRKPSLKFHPDERWETLELEQ